MVTHRSLFHFITFAVLVFGIVLPATAPVRFSLAATPAQHTVPARAIASGHDVITSTTPLSITATSGLTILYLPSQVYSGKHLPVRVHTLPYARLTLTVAFADGTQMVQQRRAGGAGDAIFAPLIRYQPLGTGETATVTLHAVEKRANLNDTITQNITVLPRIDLRKTAMRLQPAAIVVPASHRPVPVHVLIVSNLAGVRVRFLLHYPDGQDQPVSGGYTANTDGVPGRFTYTQSLNVLTDHGAGVIRVQAILTYQGISHTIYGQVILRAHR